jgi:hypothetical protein
MTGSNGPIHLTQTLGLTPINGSFIVTSQSGTITDSTKTIHFSNVDGGPSTVTIGTRTVDLGPGTLGRIDPTGDGAVALLTDRFDLQPWTTRTITFDPNGDLTGNLRAFDDPGRWLSQHILEMNHLAGYDEPAAENMIASIGRAAIRDESSGESLPSALSYEPRFGPSYDFSEGDFNVDFDPASGVADVDLSGDLNGFDGSWVNDAELSGFDWDGGDDDGFDLFPTDFDVGSWEGGDWGPVVLDLDGNGVDIVGREDSPVYFNLDGDAALEKTAWAGKNDGFLVIDLAADGGSGADGAVWHRRHGDAYPQPLPRAA